MNLIYEEAIKHSKSIPDFSQTDQYQVALTLHGTVQDANFVRFLEKVGNERVAAFSTQDFLALDLIHREQKIPAELKPRLEHLLEQGIIERVTRGKFVLSRQFYTFLGKKGQYTRKKGLDRAQNKALLLKHIQDNTSSGTPLSELLQVLPSHSDSQVQALLRSLKRAGQIHLVGKTKGGKWYPGPAVQADGEGDDQELA
jgi:ATP-dependent DNA helicase RecG